ncbi:MAG: universal stress protein, partial [Burkholderiaceae bacterium]
MKILLPIDGSEHSRAAVDFVASRTTLIGTDPHVDVLNVQLSVPARAARAVGKALVHSYHEEESDKILKPALQQLAKAGVEADLHLRVGHPAEEISAAAEKFKSDLVVMGSHGRTDLKGLLFGSVTNNVMARSQIPLLLIRSKGAPSKDSLKVAIAVDGSRYGREAVKYALRHFDLFGAKPSLTLVHVAADFAGSVMPDMAGLALPAFSEAEVVALQKKVFEAA